MQHRVEARGAEFWRPLENGANLSVCGDASRMAKDVDQALVDLISEQGGMTDDRTRAHVAGMSA